MYKMRSQIRRHFGRRLKATKVQHPLLEGKWSLGVKDRGLGRCDYAVLIGASIVVECPDREVAEHLIKLHNEKL